MWCLSQRFVLEWFPIGISFSRGPPIFRGNSLLVSGGVHSNTTSPHNTGHLKVETLQSTHLLEHLHDKIYVLCRVWHVKARLKLKCCGPTLQDTNHDPTQPQPKSEPFNYCGLDKSMFCRIDLDNTVLFSMTHILWHLVFFLKF